MIIFDTPRQRRRLLAGGALWLLACAPIAGWAQSSMDGVWVLNEDASVSPEDAFDDKLERDAVPIPYQSPGRGQATSPRDASQDSYWETVRAGRERHSLKNLHRLGTAYPLVIARRLDIASIAPDRLAITYDEALPRELRLNPAGRVFSASGAELVEDTIGFSLAYREGDSVVIETDPPDGGKVTERLRVTAVPRRLEYRIRIDMRVLTEPVEFVRVMEPAGGPGS